MRAMTSLVAMLLLAATVQAQGPAPYVIPSVPAPRDPLPRFTIAPLGAPLGRIGLPLPPIGLRPPATARERDRRSRQGMSFPWPMMVFYVSQPIIAPAPPPEPISVETPPPAGRLILDVEPATAQV